MIFFGHIHDFIENHTHQAEHYRDYTSMEIRLCGNVEGLGLDGPIRRVEPLHSERLTVLNLVIYLGTTLLVKPNDD